MEPTPSPTFVRRRRDAHLVEAAGMHGIDLAYQDVGRHLVLGAAELSERCQQSEIIEGLDRQRQAQGPGLRAVFGSRHGRKYLRHFTGYNRVIISLKPLAGESNHASLILGEGFRSTSLKRLRSVLTVRGSAKNSGLAIP